MDEFFSFGAVCKSWKVTTSMFEKITSLPPGFPLVLLSAAAIDCDIYKNLSLGVSGVYCLSTSKTYELELPEAMGRKCLGTARGWLLTVDLDLNVNLLHPFSRQQIPLPSLLAFEKELKYRDPRSHPQVFRWHDMKLAMSLYENTSREECIVVIFTPWHLDLLLFARLGDQVWTSSWRSIPKDVYIYAVDSSGVLFICDVYNNEVAHKAVTSPVRMKRTVPYLDVLAPCRARRYLVESSGDLLLVSRLYQEKKNPSRLAQKLISRYPFTYSAMGFLVHKLEQENSGGIGGFPYRWKEVKDLGGRTLFLGGNASVSSCSSKRVKPDCIYFSQDEREMYNYKGGWKMGIYNMKTDTIELLDYPPEFRVPNPPVFYV